MAETITIRAFTERDLAPTLEMLRLALGETPLLSRTPEWFGWKHFDNPFGRSILVVAESDNRIVGLRAFMRWELATPSGGTLRCVRAVDTATHPDHQRQGIFRKLTLESLERAAADGVDLVFNTPNPRSGAGYLKMGWADVGEIDIMVHPTWRLARPGTRERGRALISGDGPPTGIRVDDRTAMGLRTPRTPEYLEWRFAGHPTAGYRRIDVEGGTAVVRPNLRHGRTELVISDVYGSAPVAAIRATRRRARADYLVCSFAHGSPERTAALRAGMIPIPRLSAFHLVARPLRELSIDVTRLENWDLAISDLELL